VRYVKLTGIAAPKGPPVEVPKSVSGLFVFSANRLPPGDASENWAKLAGVALAVDAEPITIAPEKIAAHRQTIRVSSIEKNLTVCTYLVESE
jgi:hypothetical protein